MSEFEIIQGRRIDDLAREAKQVRERVQKMMGWTHEKAVLWMNTENPMLGGARPMSLIEAGRTHKLMQFIDAAEAENAK